MGIWKLLGNIFGKSRVEEKIFSIVSEEDGKEVKYYFTFRRSGNVVDVDVTITVPIGLFAFARIIPLDDYIPDFAKPTFLTFNTASIDSDVRTGGMGTTSDGYVVLDSLGRIELVKRNYGKFTQGYVLTSIYSKNQNTMSDKEEHLKYHLTYIIDNNSTEEYAQGDVNGDGEVDENDLQIIQDYVMNRTTLTPAQFKAADINNDGEVTSADYILLKNKLGI